MCKYIFVPNFKLISQREANCDHKNDVSDSLSQPINLQKPSGHAKRSKTAIPDISSRSYLQLDNY